MATNRPSLQSAIPPFKPTPSTYPEMPDKLARAFPEFGKYHDEHERFLRSLVVAVRSGYDDTALEVTNLAKSLNDGLTEVSRVSTQSKKAITMVTELSVNFDDMVNASVTQVLSVYATKDYAEAKASEALTAATANATAQVNTLSQAMATQDSALALQISNLNSAVSGAQSNITTIQSTYATQSFAEAKKTEAINAAKSYTDSAISGGITVDLSAYATKDYADTKKNEAIYAAAGDATAKVNTEASTRATADGFLSGKYAVMVNANNAATGFVITSASAPNGGTVSNFDVVADNFRVWTSGGAKTPFTVSGDDVTISNLMVKGNLSGVNISRSGGLFHPSYPTVYFKSTEAVVLVGSKNWGSGNSWSFTHGVAKMMEGPGHTSYSAKHFNVHEDGVARFEVFGQIIGYTGVLCIYFQKNSSGQFTPVSSVNSSDGGSARIVGYYEAALSPTDYIEWYIAPCDASGNLQAGAVNQTFSYDLTVLALNW